MKPRNSLVTVVEVKDAEVKTDSGLVVPQATGQSYKQCEVVEVGPGLVVEGDQSSTGDLRSGQRVLVKLNQRMQGPAGGAHLQPIGVKFKDAQDRDLVLVEESQIVAILADPAVDRLLN
jgi:co-chaperonin GroES (HSP10)